MAQMRIVAQRKDARDHFLNHLGGSGD